ncbi:hypothetical protein [Bacillus sp. 179-C3.3 HS]|uniref:hypothetical protein n=1 Tax=Bacillus sp. 179-C3.3 HS TaxID=3232162 RepID=UPI0039A08A0D
MKKWLVGFVMLTLVVIGIYFFLYARTLAFLDVISLERDKVSAVDIMYKDQKVLIENKEDIRQFVDELTEIKLKKAEGNQDVSKTSLVESYQIRLFEGGKEAHGLTFFDQDVILIDSKDESRVYRIVGTNPIDIEEWIQ